MSANVSTILLIGAGQLGSRYLQGLAKCKAPLRIFVHDIFPESLALAQERWNEVADFQSQHSVSFHTSLDSAPSSVDLVVLATTAGARPALVAQVLRRSAVRFWILEKVLAQSEPGIDSMLSDIAGSGKAWVNTARRAIPWHQSIKDQLGLARPIALSLQGGLWGIACNAVHYLDLLSWWSGESLEQVNTLGLDPQWFESKRPGNWEVSGTLEARYSGGSYALLTATSGAAAGALRVTDGSLSWEINEASGLARRSDGLEVLGRMEFQSNLTTGIVDAILATGECSLPSLQESAELHRIFVRGLQAHWVQEAGNPNATFVPIT